MNKVFLSHSSKDKPLYLRLVAEKLGIENIEYDEFTFEEGEKTDDEIETRLDNCDLFALFISEYALASPWVLKEITRAGQKIEKSKLNKIYPIIIDPNIDHTDKRIPSWIVDQYNLKYISRPVVAARRIQAKLREMHWAQNPNHKDRQLIFVGRNELLKDFENRIDNIDLPKPSCIFASGIQRIGRSSLMKHALVKSSMLKATYTPLKISLDRIDNIEDLIIKIFDTGLTSASQEEMSDMLNKSMEIKIALLNKILIEIQKAKEIIFVEDNGCFLNNDREIIPWLISALAGLKPTPVLCISAKYRLNRSHVRNIQNIYSIELPELSPSERSGLLKRLFELHDIEVSIDDFNFFAKQLKGFPEEAYFCTDLILDRGLNAAKASSHELTEFNTERASVLLRRFEKNQKALDFIYFLSEFEFIAVSFIYEIVNVSDFQQILEEMVAHSICDYIGNEQEYIRLNDTIRDLVKRNRLTLPDEYKERLRQHVKNFVKDTNKFERDASDFFYSIKESLAAGEKIEEEYLVPSHILRTIRELYYRRSSFNRIIILADMLLGKQNSLDPKVAEEARYYLCLSLARQKNMRVLKEVREIKGPEQNFILGFYYRLCGRHVEAIERLNNVVGIPYIAARAKRELVQVYLYIEEFEKALTMAQENYESNRGNQFPIQAYLNCLLNSENPSEQSVKIESLIAELEQIGSDQSLEMGLIGKAMYAAKAESNKTKAYNYISDAIATSSTPYPYLAKFDIALRFFDKEIMHEALQNLERYAEAQSISENTLIKNKAFYLAALNQVNEAKDLISSRLKNYPTETINKYLLKIDNISHNQ